MVQFFSYTVPEIAYYGFKCLEKSLKLQIFWLLKSLFPPGFQVFGEMLISATPPGGVASGQNIYRWNDLLQKMLESPLLN